MQSKLSVVESRLNFALECAGQGVWDHDLATRSMYFSPSWYQMRGMSLHQDVDGSLECWLKRVHPDDHQHVIAASSAYGPHHRSVWVFEYRERHKDGHYIWIQSRGRHVAWDSSGRATRTLGTDTDITDRKHAEHELLLISSRLEIALDASKIGVWEHHTENGVIHWDRRMYEIYGLSPGPIEMSGVHWEHQLHHDDLQRVKTQFSKAIARKEDYASQFRIALPDGRIRHVRSSGRYFSDSMHGSRMIGAEWDITEDIERGEELQSAKVLAEVRLAELQQAQEQIQHAALHDHLTQLPNRRYLEQRLVEIASSPLPQRGSLAVLHVDLDRFKEVNDTYGHAAGDHMLKHVAGVLRKSVREGDFVARVGGDEFVILSKFSGDYKALKALAARIIAGLRQSVHFEGYSLRVGVSIGIAHADSVTPGPLSLLKQADAALYKAKNAGRNQFQFAESKAA